MRPGDFPQRFADDGELLGWVTARGLLRHREADWRRVKAGEAISEPCVAVAPSASVPAAIDALDADVTRLVVCVPEAARPTASSRTQTS